LTQRIKYQRGSKIKIYDCFTFYNELDLLELRFEELYNTVDYFVLVEASTTFTNRSKPYYFEENLSRYKKYLDKVIHLQIDDMPSSTNPWDNETFQRNQILEGINDAGHNDIIIVTDVDEIPRPAAINHMRNSEQSLFALRMPLFNFKFNYMKFNPDRYSVWGMASQRIYFDDITPDTLRSLRFQFFDKPHQYASNGLEMIEHGGWHFGYFGDKEYLIDKAKSFSHSEVNTPEFLAQIDPVASIAKKTSWKQDSDDQYVIVDLDDYFPATVLSNQEKYKDYILDNPSTAARTILPPYTY
jgi:Glycosyltransferase family 17